MKEIREFYGDLWIWKQMCNFYEEHPDHPSRWIHEEAKKNIDIRRSGITALDSMVAVK